MTTWVRYPYDGTVVVTGAGSGIGQAIARTVQETVEAFPEERVLVRTADVSDRTEVEDLFVAGPDASYITGAIILVEGGRRRPPAHPAP